MRDILLTILMLAAFIVLAGCNRLQEGTVIEKVYEPAEEYIFSTTMWIGKTPIMQTHHGYDDEDFTVLVMGIYDGDTIIEKFYLTKEAWTCIETGNWFVDTVDCSRTDNNNTEIINVSE